MVAELNTYDRPHVGIINFQLYARYWRLSCQRNALLT